MPKLKLKRRGHPVLFDGPREKMSIKLTTVARAEIRATQAMLKDIGHGHAATEAAAVEYLVRKGAKADSKLPRVHKQVAVATLQNAPVTDAVDAPAVVTYTVEALRSDVTADR